MKSCTFFIDAREAFGILYGYDPLTGEDYEMEKIDECEVPLLSLETATA